MQHTDAAKVLSRWGACETALTCVAELRPGPATIRMPSCRLEPGDILRSECSVVSLSGWKDASVETSWRGTKIEVTYEDGAAVVIADYDCEEVVNAMSS